MGRGGLLSIFSKSACSVMMIPAEHAYNICLVENCRYCSRCMGPMIWFNQFSLISVKCSCRWVNCYIFTLLRRDGCSLIKLGGVSFFSEIREKRLLFTWDNILSP